VNARKRRCIAAGLVAAVIVAVITVWGIGVARVARALLGNVREARALVAEPGDIGFEAAGQLLLDVRANVLALDRRAGWLVPPAGGLGWVPKVGPLLAQAPAAMELADSLTAVGVLMWRDLQPVVRLYEQGVGPADLVPDAARALVIDQGVKSELAARAASACEVLDPAAVPDQYSDELQMVCDLTPLMASGLRAVDALPRMLGLDRPRTYLVLALNEDELRPGGGFITGVGEVFPYIRSHNVLNNLQSVAKTHPTVMFFPGEYIHSDDIGSALELFGCLEDDRYYRAFNIYDYQI